MEDEIPKEIREESNRILKELKKLEEDPEVLRRGKEFAKKISTLTPEQLLREFTI